MSSRVMPKGIPNSSVLAYLLPILVPESSTLEDILAFVNKDFIYWAKSLSWGTLTTGKMEHLIGEIFGGRHIYVLFSSLILKLCSRVA